MAADDGFAAMIPGRQNTWPSRTHATWTGPPGSIDSEFEPAQSTVANGPYAPLAAHWVGWRLWALVAGVLFAIACVVGLTRHLTAAPSIDATWVANGQGRIGLAASNDPALLPYVGKALVGAVGNAHSVALIDAIALHQSARWVIDDSERARQEDIQQQLAAVLTQPRVTLIFADGTKAVVEPKARGFASLPVVFWLLPTAALALYLIGVVVYVAHPTARNLLYAAMASCQAANLFFIAIEAAYSFGQLPTFGRLNMPLRVGLDLITSAAAVHVSTLHPRRLPGSLWIALAGWTMAAGLIAMHAAGWLAHIWWWTQGAMIVAGLVCVGLLSWSYRIESHPVAIVLRRFGIVAVATLTLLVVAIVMVERSNDLPHNAADVGSMVWYIFLGSLLLVVPFLSQSPNCIREFALLAAISTFAASLDLTFVAALSVGQSVSLVLSVFASLALYSGLRRWILNQLLGSSTQPTERMFEQLYRIAREVEAQPDRAPLLLAQLLGDLFEPLEVSVIERAASKTRLAGDGASLLVPVPQLVDASTPGSSVMIRFAQRGQRLFTSEDARLTDRVVEQLRRAVQFDKAVEQGRNEERLRLAQDLHDDIGARLLTLMYKAQSPEMEDYVRHTLQDLKTLTRGLAASNHRLSHAAAEWKADLTHRLTAAHVGLKWSFGCDNDVMLTVVHWSALTRILRELVSNAIAHSQAQQLAIDFQLANDGLELTITDDGVGRDPRTWSHGLGLSGVRKRVKQLGGTVEWREASPRGISCRVTIRDLSSR